MPRARARGRQPGPAGRGHGRERGGGQEGRAGAADAGAAVGARGAGTGAGGRSARAAPHRLLKCPRCTPRGVVPLPPSMPPSPHLRRMPAPGPGRGGPSPRGFPLSVGIPLPATLPAGKTLTGAPPGWDPPSLEYFLIPGRGRAQRVFSPRGPGVFSVRD